MSRSASQAFGAPYGPVAAPTLGVDLGERILAAMATKNGAATFTVDGRAVCTLHDELVREEDSQVRGELRHALEVLVDRAAERVIEYAVSQGAAALVLEDEPFADPPALTDHTVRIRGVDNPGGERNRWLLPALGERIHEQANSRGIDVKSVSAAFSSQTCHACGHVGSRSDSRFMFYCRNRACEIDEMQADTNAAAVLARRADDPQRACPIET